MTKDVLAMLGVKVSKDQGSGKSDVKAPKIADASAALQINKDLKVFKNRWSVSPYLIKNVPQQVSIAGESVKVAAFDLDGTLISTKSGSIFARHSDDWKWWTPTEKQPSKVKAKISQLAKDNYLIVIFTNQGAIVPNLTAKSFQNFAQKLNQIESELAADGVDSVLVFSSSRKPSKKEDIRFIDLHKRMRKPDVGMWDELVKYLQERGMTIDIPNSFFVGDAAGRPNDFSDSDKAFAEEIKLPFKVPEDVF